MQPVEPCCTLRNRIMRAECVRRHAGHQCTIPDGRMLPGITKREGPPSALSVETPLGDGQRGMQGWTNTSDTTGGWTDGWSVNRVLFRSGAGHSRVTDTYEFDKKQRRSLEASEKEKKIASAEKHRTIDVPL